MTALRSRFSSWISAREIETEIYTNAYHRLVSAHPMSLQSNDQRYRLGFIGAGKLAGSVMRGLVRAKFCAPEEILVSEPNEVGARCRWARSWELAVTAENAEVAEKAEVILLGVKPGVVLAGDRRDRGARRRIDSSFRSPPGSGVAAMEGKGKARFMRAMTNTPAAVCQAATAIARGARTTGSRSRPAREIFSAIGIVVEVDERTNRRRDRARRERAGVRLHGDRSARATAERIADCRRRFR